MIFRILTFALLATLAWRMVTLADTADGTDAEIWRPADGDEIRFDVLRQGKPFGHHTVSFSRTDDGELDVSVDVELRAGLGPLTLFRYELDSSERWRDGELIEVTGEAREDGERESMQAEREGDQLRVQGDAFTGEVPASLLPASHWNVAQTRASQLISTENGELIEVQVRDLGRETILAGGQEIPTNKYLLDSDIDVTLWYDDAGRWVKLAFEARGQSIEYVLAELY